MKLIYIEWLKLKNHRFFWIGMSLYLICMVLVTVVAGYFKPFNQGGEEGMIVFSTLGDAGLYKLPYIWQHLTYLGAFIIKFIPAILLIFFITSEYTNKTMRQNVIDGLSKFEFFSSKMLTALLMCIVSLTAITIITAILALLNNESFTVAEFFEGSSYLIAYFFEILFTCIFASFLAFLFRKSAIAIVVLMIYYFFIEPIIGFALGEPLKYFLPTAASRELNVQPFTRLMGVDAALSLKSPDSVSTKYLLMTFFYSLLFAVGGLLILKKRDL